MTLAMGQIELGGEAIAEYNERGYWISPKMFDEKEVEELRAAVMRIVRGEKDFDCMHFGFPPRFDLEKKHLVQVLNGWWVNRKIRELLERPEIG